MWHCPPMLMLWTSRHLYKGGCRFIVLIVNREKGHFNSRKGYVTGFRSRVEAANFEILWDLHVWHTGSMSTFIQFYSSKKQCLSQAVYFNISKGNFWPNHRFNSFLSDNLNGFQYWIGCLLGLFSAKWVLLIWNNLYHNSGITVNLTFLFPYFPSSQI